ncbi:MAG: hypothetical protein QG657_1748 [Acidobacteriota bacterium]|nr:hypothetical protein [Acidobacteriota bacterium]
MEIEKPFACASTLVVPIVLTVICLLYSNSYAQQQSASAAVEFELAPPLAIIAFNIDGTDALWTRTANETCDLGNVDSRGTPISGAPVGNPNVNGIAGIPVDSTGAPLASFDDPGCVGAFYPLLAATGGGGNNNHPNSALLIRVRTNSAWTLTYRAQLLAATTNVTVDQLKWKMDAAASNGYQGYTAFPTADTLLASGAGAVNTRYYVDYGLLVEDADAPGANSWLVTYTLTSN